MLSEARARAEASAPPRESADIYRKLARDQPERYGRAVDHAVELLSKLTDQA